MLLGQCKLDVDGLRRGRHPDSCQQGHRGEAGPWGRPVRHSFCSYVFARWCPRTRNWPIPWSPKIITGLPPCPAMWPTANALTLATWTTELIQIQTTVVCRKDLDQELFATMVFNQLIGFRLKQMRTSPCYSWFCWAVNMVRHRPGPQHALCHAAYVDEAMKQVFSRKPPYISIAPIGC